MRAIAVTGVSSWDGGLGEPKGDASRKVAPDTARRRRELAAGAEWPHFSL
jgi:hypothetical protein